MSKKRERIDRTYWGWAEDFVPGCLTDKDLKTAYRLIGKQHKPNSCRKNCKYNPNCLSGFGEQSLNQTIDKDAELESYMSSKIRVPGTYVGLKNLGNTCYINSLLQLWFHNIPFREAVYGWNALEDKQENAKHLEVYNRPVDLDNYEPLSSIAHLQYLFCEMQFGLKKYCDPGAFCRSLSIDVELQQDAQEFNKLYMQRLEESFQSSSNEKTRRLIQDQFRGEYSYVTTCCNCSKESERQSYFYELELKVKNCNSILDSLQEFLNEEPLTGDNKYFCSNCNDKHNAFTRIKLQELPPVLQLQLLRYEIDSVIGTRRKIHSAIQFPDVLDMSAYLDKIPNTFNYKLIAVLMHGGSTAYSGHYYAHINTADGWHVFDDINVKKEKHLNLASEENLIPVAERKICGPKLKGFRSSSSVYMLVYRRVDKNESSEISSSTDIVKSSFATYDDLNRKLASPKCVDGRTQEKNATRKKFGKNLKNSKSTKKKDVSHDIVSQSDGNETQSFYKENGIGAGMTKSSSVNIDCFSGDQSIDGNGTFGMRSNSFNDRSVLLSNKRDPKLENVDPAIMNECEQVSVKDKDNILLNWLAEMNSNGSLKENISAKPTNDVSKFIWTKLTSFNIIDDVGDVYLVFDNKVLNHPRLRILNDHVLKSSDEEGSDVKPDSRMNGEVSSNECDTNFIEADCTTKSAAENFNPQINSTERADSGTDNISGNLDQNQRQTLERVLEKTVNDFGSAGGGDDGGEKDGDPGKKNDSDGNIEFRSKMDEEHWNMLPDYLKRALLKSRHEVRSSFNTQLVEIDSRIDTQSMVKAVSEAIMPDTNTSDYEFINFEWLKFITKNSVPPVDNSNLLCKHGKLSIKKSSCYKAISAKIGDFLYEKFSGGPRLKSDALCRLCVENKARQVKLQMDVAKDYKLLVNLTKQPIEQLQTAYWVGKRTLRKWTNYVLDELDDDGIDDDEDIDLSNALKEEDMKKDMCDQENVNDRIKTEFDEEFNESFNDDIICEHYELTVEENDRKLVSEVVWNIFLKYFPKAKAFERDHSPCVLCQNRVSQDKEHRDTVRKNAMIEKETLKDLFEKKQTCDLTGTNSGTYLVDSVFMSKWRKYIRSYLDDMSDVLSSSFPVHSTTSMSCGLSHEHLLFSSAVPCPAPTAPISSLPVSSARTCYSSIQRQTMLDAPRPKDLISSLLCTSHNLLLYDPEVDVERFAALNQQEWMTLSSFYPAELELRVIKEENGSFSPSIGICHECLGRRRLAEAEQDLQNSYINASIYVWKLDNTEDFDSDDNDESPNKRRKLNNCKPEDVAIANQSLKKPEQVRRSARARQPKKGKKLFVINRFTTLKDLKIMIFNKFTVMPTDQHLSLNGEDLDALKERLQLSDSDATLINLNVKPNDVLQLVADEPNPGANICESEGFLMPEAGFKGTELGGR